MVSTLEWTRSDELRAVASQYFPGAVNSNVRLAAPGIFFDRASGARIWDVDGNDYIDYILGQGPLLLGHVPENVNRRVFEACSRGNLFGGQHPQEIDAGAAVLRAIGWADMIRFSTTGTEAVQAALRLARAATKRTRFIRFEGQYHGWLDNVLVTSRAGVSEPASEGQVRSHLADSVMLPWNDLDAIEGLLMSHPDEFAAIITEPVMVNAGSLEPLSGYLEGMRTLCERYGVILIFDEVITGFRLGLSGAAGLYGVVPDLATYGKAMAGGWPVAAVAGRRDLMEPIGTGAVNHSGTFNASAMATASVIATLEELANPGVYQSVEEYGTELKSNIERLGAQHGTPLRVQGPPSALHVSFGQPGKVVDYQALHQLDLDRFSAFARVLARHGIWSTARGTWYVSSTHGPQEMADTVQRLSAALKEFMG